MNASVITRSTVQQMRCSSSLGKTERCGWKEAAAELLGRAAILTLAAQPGIKPNFLFSAAYTQRNTFSSIECVGKQAFQVCICP